MIEEWMAEIQHVHCALLAFLIGSLLRINAMGHIAGMLL